MVILALGFVVVGTMVIGVVAATEGGSGMVLRKRMGGSKNNDSSEGEDDSEPSKSVDAKTSDDEDETEVEKRSRTKRKKSKKKKKTHFQCRFCTANFTESQALGGHMNCHRVEKSKEALENATELLANSARFAANLWDMQGHPGYNSYGSPPLMPNTQAGPNRMGSLLYNVQASGSLQLPLIVNQDLSNTHGQHFPMHGGGGGEGGYYNPTVDGRMHYNPMPPLRPESMMSPSTYNVQMHYNPMPPHRDSMLQERLPQDHGQPSGTFHHSETLLDMMMNNAQSIRPSSSEYSTLHQSPHSHFVDEHGNLSRDFESGPSSQVMPEDDLPLNVRSVRIERSEQIIFQGPEVSQDESSASVEPGQASFDTDAFIDNSGTLM